MDSMGLFHGLYMVNMVAILLCLPNSIMNIRLPRPNWSCPSLMMAEVSLFKNIIAVPSGL